MPLGLLKSRANLQLLGTTSLLPIENNGKDIGSVVGSLCQQSNLLSTFIKNYGKILKEAMST